MPVIPQKAQLIERVQNALDVSGAFKNCFFHTYALHLLANDLPLPQDLFTFKSIAGNESRASKLQAIFPDQASLSLFADYARRLPSSEKPTSLEFIVEKTLVLGFLLREWFATKTKQLVTLNVSEQFHQFKSIMKSNYGTGDEQNMLKLLLSDSNGILYKSNEAFLKYFTTRPKSVPLTDEETRYDKYFTDAANDDNKAIEAYWKAEGFQKYCEKFATPGSKIAYADIEPVIENIQQSLTVYNITKNAETGVTTVGINKDIPGNQPQMEVQIDTKTQHYRLLRTAKTTAFLDSYEKSLAQYKKDRAAVIYQSTADEREVTAAKVPSLLVKAICGKGYFAKAPFNLLLDQLADFKKCVDDHPLHLLEQHRAADQLRHAEEEFLGLHSEPDPHEEELELKRELAQENFYKQLEHLTTLISDFESRKNKSKKGDERARLKNARDAVQTLYNGLSKLATHYFGLKKPGRDQYNRFKSACEELIKPARKELDSHRGMSELFANITIAILTVGVGIVIKGAINKLILNKSFFHVHDTQAAKDVEKIEESIKKASPEAPRH